MQPTQRPILLGVSLSVALALTTCRPDVPAAPPDAVPAAMGSTGTVLASMPPADSPPDLAGPAPPAPQGLAAAVKPPLPPQPPEQAPPPSPRVDNDTTSDLPNHIASYFQGQKGRRIYLQTDKPIYKPGETIWLRLWDLAAKNFADASSGGGLNVELVSPRGAVVLKRRVRGGGGQTDLPLGAGLAGGEYTIRLQTFDGQRAQRPVIVSTYEAPRLQMKLDFLRKAYGAGDEVSATLTVRRATGEALRDHPLTGMVRLDGQDLPQVQLRTDESGEAVVRFTLPGRIDTGDGLLTVLAEDGGLTESVARRVPIVVNRLSLSAFPEGGNLVEGLPGRVYFEAKTPLGKPADLAGRVVDDRGAVVSEVRSVRDGLGRFELTPSPGRSYHLEIDRPVGIADPYPLPPALASGCVLRSFDDLDGQLTALRVAVRCDVPQRVLVSATLRDNVLDSAAVDVPGGAPAVVYLEPRDPALLHAQGVARITVFDAEQHPLAERLVYRNRRARLDVKVEPQRKTYAPRDEVELTLTTADPSGQPLPAQVALSVVDDTVLTYADDKTGHMLSKLYLEAELPDKIEEPNFYFDLGEDRSALGMDLLMGAKGYRKFEWQKVLQRQPRPNKSMVLATRPLRTVAVPMEDQLKDFGGLRKEKPADKDPGPDAGKDKERAKAAPPPAPSVLAMAPPAGPAPVKPAPRVYRDAADDPMMATPQPVAKAPRPATTAATAEPSMAPMAPMAPIGRTPAASVAPMPHMPPMNEKREQAEEHRMAPAKKAPGMAGGRAADKALADEDGLAGNGVGDLKVAAQGQVRGKQDMGQGIAALRPDDGRRALRMRPDQALQPDGAGGLAMPMQMPMHMHIAPRPRPVPQWAPVRVFPVPAYRPDYSGPRTDFRETVFFAPAVRTDRDGKATVRFFLSDAIAAFRVTSEGVGGGAAGRSETVLKSSLPFSMAVKVPLEVSEGDHLELPLQLSNEREAPLAVDLTADFGALLHLDRPVTRTQGTLQAGAREALFYPLTVSGKRGKSTLRFAASAGGLRDEFVREVVVSPRGFPQHVARSGNLRDRFVADLDLGEMLPDTADGKLRLYPSPVASMVAGLEGLLQEPNGCFEQASSANYPNVMILRYLKLQHHADAQLLGRTSQLLDTGYKRLIGYETPKKGYEWFGAAPPHEALTAYGLMEFTDMQEVYPEVDRGMVQRTAAWLRGRSDGKGGFYQDGKALDTFGHASKEVTDAYITYSLVEARQPGLEAELSAAEGRAKQSDDAYILALSAGSLLSAGRRDAGQAAAARLVAMQDESGGFLKASHSITRSGGDSLHIETTALAVLALLRAGGQDEAVRRAVEWLVSHRGGYGQWGATQSTVLALKALTAYAVASRRTQSPGDVTLRVNGEVIGTQHYEAGRRAPIVFAELDRHLRQGKNQIEVLHQGNEPLPFTLGLDYRSLKPASSAQSPVELTTALERGEVNLGESVRMNVTVRNRTDAGQPMTLVRVGLPGGLSYQTWQLKELRDKGLIAFYETGPREVNLYLRQLKPREEVRLPLDLLASVPGSYAGPASRAYLYYTSEHKSWVDGVSVKIKP